MADINKTVQILFSADNQMSDAFRDINDHIGTVDSSFGGLGGRALNLVEDIAILGLAVTAIATTFATLAAKSAAEYETALLDLQKVMDDSEGSANQYSQTFLKMAIDYGKSTTEIVQGVADFKQAGFDVVESLQLQTDALNLSIAGDIAAAESSEYLISILKGFKAPASEAAEVVDILNEVSNKYATDVQQLAIGMATLSPIANTMGFSFAETAGILTPVIEVFRSGGEAAVALQTGLLKLLDNSRETQLALEKLGVSQFDVNGHLKSGKEILLEVSTAFQTLDTNDKLYVATQLTGIHQAGKMVEVFDGLNKSIEITAVGMDSAGSAMKEVEIRMGSAEFKVGQLTSAWDAFLTVAGSSILEELKPILDDITTALTSPEGVVIAEALGEAISNWIGSIVEFLDNLQEIYGEMTGIKDASMAVDFAKWAGDIETIQFTLKAINSVVQGLLLPVAAVHDGFVGTASFINTALLSSIVLIGEALIKVMQIFDYIPGLDLAAPIEEMREATNGFKETWAEATKALFGAGTESQYWSDNVANSIAVVDEAINRLGEDGGKTGDKIKAGGDVAKTSMEGLTAALNPLALALSQSYESAYDFNIEAEKGTSGIEALNGVMQDGVAVFTDGSWSIEKVTSELVKNAAALDTAKSSTQSKAEADKKAAEELEKNVDAMVKFKLGLEEIQSKERVSIFEIQANVDMAAMEQATQQFETMFTSISDGMNSTSETLLGLFGMMGTASSTAFGMETLLEAIDKEQALRQKEFDLQEKLIEAQIEYMTLKTQALGQGEALINITGDGLEPELEAFMWQILKRIQIRANAEGAEYLLGI